MGFLGTSLIFAVIKIIASLLVRICCSRSPYTNSMTTSIKHFKKAEKSMKTMEANAIMVACSYKRKVLVMIRHDSDNAETCQAFEWSNVPDLWRYCWAYSC